MDEITAKKAFSKNAQVVPLPLVPATVITVDEENAILSFLATALMRVKPSSISTE